MTVGDPGDSVAQVGIRIDAIPFIGRRSGTSRLIQIIDAHSRFVLLSRRKWEGRRVVSYRVCFFNDIPRNERLFRCCQRSIVVRSANSPEEAIEAAKEQFMRVEGVRDWRFHAAHIEVEIMDENPVKAAVRQAMAATDAQSGRRHNSPSQRV